MIEAGYKCIGIGEEVCFTAHIRHLIVCQVSTIITFKYEYTFTISSTVYVQLCTIIVIYKHTANRKC
jgi:hypothetical protein